MVKRADVPVMDVLRAHRDYRAEMDAALAAYAGVGPGTRLRTALAVTAIMEPGFPIPARPYERLPFPYKVVMARIMQLVDQGLLDYGVSPNVAFLTETGQRMLAEAEEEVARR